MKTVKKWLKGVLATSVIVLNSIAVLAEGDYPAEIRDTLEDDYTGKTVILHSNDVHGAIDGYAKMAALKEDFEDRNAEVIVVDAGDFLQGDPYVNQSKGEDAVTMMNAAGYDICTLGNHEFDYGYARLKEDLEKAEFTVLCANVTENGEAVFTPHLVYETASGVKIGFFGLDTPETMTKSKPGNVDGLEFTMGEETCAAAQTEVDTLKKEGADVIIALCHLGVNKESTQGGNASTDLYHGTKGIDLIIDGHSHTVMTEGSGGEPIQSTGTKFANIGVVVIDEDGTISDRWLMSTEGLREDEYTTSIAFDIKARINAEYNVVFARSEVELDGVRNHNRTMETNNGDFCTDVLMWYAENNPSLVNMPMDHVVTLIVGGAIRDKIPQGDITKKDINTVHPFSSTISVVHVTGAELLESLEAATFSVPDPIGGYPHMSGIEYTIDTTKAYDAGELYPDSTYARPASIQRVTIQSVQGQPFREDDTYAVVTEDFTAMGGDTYYVFGTKERSDNGDLMDELVMEYITEELGGVIPASEYKDIRGNVTILYSEENTPEPQKEETVYTVQKGDSLWKIALEHYNDGNAWQKIYENNLDVIVNPSLIYPGQTLELPVLQ